MPIDGESISIVCNSQMSEGQWSISVVSADKYDILSIARSEDAYCTSQLHRSNLHAARTAERIVCAWVRCKSCRFTAYNISYRVAQNATWFGLEDIGMNLTGMTAGVRETLLLLQNGESDRRMAWVDVPRRLEAAPLQPQSPVWGIIGKRRSRSMSRTLTSHCTKPQTPPRLSRTTLIALIWL